MEAGLALKLAGDRDARQYSLQPKKKEKEKGGF
jgi:hypothetical protein